MRLKLFAVLNQQLCDAIAPEEPGLSQKTKRAAALKATVDALLKMRKVMPG